MNKIELKLSKSDFVMRTHPMRKVKRQAVCSIKLVLSIASLFLFLNACHAQKKYDREKQKENLVFAKIDSVSLNEIKQGGETNQSILDYYKIELIDEVEIWSDKMFGRCCTEADLLYSELLYFEISANTKNVDYPDRHLSDQAYSTTYAFKESQKIEISLRLKRNTEHHFYHTKLFEDEVLKSNDTILKPFRLSLVNGYTKSQKTFNQNGRVKAMKIFVNNIYKSTVLLKDTPLVQEFLLDFIFFKNDVIKLIPISYYKGTKYDDICLSEIQSSLAHITHPSINKKYVINELRKE